MEGQSPSRALPYLSRLRAIATLHGAVRTAASNVIIHDVEDHTTHVRAALIPPAGDARSGRLVDYDFNATSAAALHSDRDPPAIWQRDDSFRPGLAGNRWAARDAAARHEKAAG